MDPLCQEEENFLRVFRLVNGAGLTSLREVFSKLNGPNSLIGILNKHGQKIFSLKGKRVISDAQYDILYPATGIPDIKKFDITLLCFLFRNIVHHTNFKNIKINWNNNPLDHQTHILNDIVRVKNVRNKLFHSASYSLSEHEFNTIWSQLEAALLRLGCSNDRIDEHKIEQLDRNLYNQNIGQLYRDSEKEKVTLKRLDSIGETTKQNKFYILFFGITGLAASILFFLHTENQIFTHANYQLNRVEVTLRAELAYYYEQKLRYFTPFPWEDRYVLDMENLFVKLTWEKGFPEEALPEINKTKNKVVDFAEIFQPQQESDGSTPKRIMLLGIAGIGKSTIMQHLAYTWGRDIKCNEISRYNFISKLWTFCFSTTGYQILFFIKLQFVKDNATLCDTVWDQMPRDLSLEKIDMCKYLKERKERLIFLFDGYDEYSVTTSKEISQTLQNELMRQSLIVLSSRPGKGENLLTFARYSSAYTLHGFDKYMGIHYISKYFANINRSADGRILIERIFDNSLIEHRLTRIPMFLHLLCIVWKESKTLPSTTTEMYTKFVSFAFLYKKESKLFDSIVEHEPSVLLLGLIAGLKFSPFSNFEIPFSNATLKNITDLVNTGLITLENNTKISLLTNSGAERNIYVSKIHFLHRSFEEFFYAYFIVHHNDSNNFLKYLLKSENVQQQIAVIESDYVFLQRFLCGLAKSEEGISSLMQIYVSHFKSVQDSYHDRDISYEYQENLAECLSEAKDLDLTEAQKIYFEFTKGSLLSQYLQNGKYLLLLRSALRKNNEMLYSVHLSYCLTDKYNIVEFGANCINIFPNLKTLHLGQGQRFMKLAHILDEQFDIIKVTASLSRLELPIPRQMKQDELDQILNQIKQIKHLRTLGLNIDLRGRGKDIGDIFCTLGGKLISLTLTNSNFRNSDLYHLRNKFKCLVNLRTLELNDIDFSDVYVVYYGPNSERNFAVNNPIRWLSITGSEFSSRTTVQFFKSIEFSEVQILNVKSVNFDMEMFEKYCMLFKTIPIFLTIDFPNLSGESVRKISKALKYFKSIHTLKMSWTTSYWDQWFYNDSVVYVAENLAKISMTDLFLKMDHITPQGLLGLSRLLRSKTTVQLEYLSLTFTSDIPQENFLHFVSSFKNLLSLKTLKIVGGLKKDTSFLLTIGLKFLKNLKACVIAAPEINVDFFELLRKVLPKIQSMSFLQLAFLTNINVSQAGFGEVITFLAAEETTFGRIPLMTINLKKTIFDVTQKANLIEVLETVCSNLLQNNALWIIKEPRLKLIFSQEIYTVVEPLIKFNNCHNIIKVEVSMEQHKHKMFVDD